MFDRYFVGFIIVVAIVAKILMGFIGDIDDSNDKMLTTKERLVMQQDQIYIVEDSIGEMVIRFTKEVPLKTKLEVIMRSNIYLNQVVVLVPDFDAIKMELKNKIEDDEAVAYITKEINKIFDKFVSGNITSQQVDEDLRNIKVLKQ